LAAHSAIGFTAWSVATMVDNDPDLQGKAPLGK
jgi:hypothetical protein